MSLPIAPNPFPTLRQGLSLGAPEHQGFAAAWNWLTGVMRKAKDYLVLDVNGKHGELTIVGGDGIQVTTSGTTITINVGDGEDENDGDADSTPAPGPTPGSTPEPTPTPTPTPGPTPGPGSGDDGGCNAWSEEETGAGDGDGGMDNGGDNCSELNGW